MQKCTSVLFFKASAPSCLAFGFAPTGHQLKAGIWNWGQSCPDRYQASLLLHPGSGVHRGWYPDVFSICLQPDLCLVIGTFTVQIQGIYGRRQQIKALLGLKHGIWLDPHLAVQERHTDDIQTAQLGRVLHLDQFH